MQGKSMAVRVAPNLPALGSAVREARVLRRMSQECLGFEAALHRNYIGSIERGEINPTFRTLVQVANGLRMPLSELVMLYEWNAAEGARS